MKSFKFGLIADTQYADRPRDIGRYYRNALKKTEQCMAAFRKQRVNFCVHLGDIIDCPNEPEKGHEALNRLLPVLNSLGKPIYYVIGNHDVASIPCSDLTAKLGMASGQTWYSFDFGNIHFIALDCNFDACAERYRPGYEQWDQCYIPAAELQWLETELHHAAAKTVVLFVHALLDDLDDPHVIRNAQSVRCLLESCGKQLVVFQGHRHCGHESVKNGIGYHTLKSIVNGRSRTCFWIVEVDSEKMLVNRYDSSLRKGEPKQEIIWLTPFSSAKGKPSLHLP